MMAQQGQVFVMKSNGPSGSPLWGYRYRTGGRGSGRVQRGGFVSEQDACESLERSLERVRRANGIGSTLTLTGLAPESGSPPNSQPGSHPSAASTIFGTRSRPSRCVPASHLSTSLATWVPA